MSGNTLFSSQNLNLPKMLKSNLIAFVFLCGGRCPCQLKRWRDRGDNVYFMQTPSSWGQRGIYKSILLLVHQSGFYADTLGSWGSKGQRAKEEGLAPGFRA